MSGLEKFQDNPAWRQKLLKHLLTDRPRPAAPKPQEESFDRRPSVGIVLDFPALIQARKAELELKQQQELENKPSSSMDSESGQKYKFPLAENTSKQMADDSFDALERMCDKTASDPDSTLFQYLNSDDKEQVLATAKRRSSRSNKSDDIETEALRRMLADVADQADLCNESPLKSAECTQLEDVEAPSRFWDNDSMLNATESHFPLKTETSPVKMVGLLRPSTILEANEADLTGLQSDESCSLNSSFLTAKTLRTELGSASGSSCYETAADNSLASSSRDVTDSAALNVDDLFYAAIAKAKPHGISKVEQEELLSDMQETLMDMALTDAADSTIIELSSSSENEEEQDGERNVASRECIKQEECSLVDLDDEEDKENKSTRLNGTIEEMEYMLKKAQEYMEANKNPPESTEQQPDPNIIHLHQKTRSPHKFIMPQRKCEPVLPEKSLPATGKSRHAINMNYPPTGKFFNEPLSFHLRRLAKNQTDNFAHIVSPIRAYTQKSATAPLMSIFREKSNNLSDTQPEEENSLICQLKRGQAAALAGKEAKANPEYFNPSAPFLPKKAYICSDLKQVVDERTPLPMPSVAKIQKYLDSASDPTVMRHDGKMKTPGKSCATNQNKSYIPRRVNQSLADLSLASGDVSLYTLKDAKKF
ncbi:hypothetical protein AWZ03_007677 [Drosophila navojoa]|uniref:Uncharacterized protein n=1 Tax=Drosophila navojoa TaxID=7232 RepID=A0A484BAS2_DRONA|nr:uncharacterized protein LOC115562985 isoform X2 [Drosophila navojoa]XP_030241117.1 uncharacterized protein LOC115562985 isoform X2 [Drosophila navojoa]TDG45957.1 hypothetical protein AWZ03_007677 [Drosophila navojoa]